MSENVIEQKIEEWRKHADEHFDFTVNCAFHDGMGSALDDAANELQAATRPEQFMPRLNIWPEDAVYIVMLTAYHSGAWFVFHDQNDRRIKSGNTEAINLDIPPGIDPRIKVSRSDMEAWEAENG